MTTDTTLAAIATLTRSLIAQDSATTDVVQARKDLIRQAVQEGHTLEQIGTVAGISRQRVSQLAREDR